MKLIILVRHGSYNQETGSLTPEGGAKVERLVPLLWRAFNQHGVQTVQAYSSTATRALESAEVVSGKLALESALLLVLLSKGDEEGDLEELLELIREKSTIDALILFTHHEYCSKFPVYYVQKVFGTIIPKLYVDTGDAVVLNCDTGQIIELWT